MHHSSQRSVRQHENPARKDEGKLQSIDKDWARTMRLRIAHLNLQEALRDAIHLLNLHTQTSRIIAIRARSAPLELQHRCSREEDVEITDSLLAPAEAGLVKDARARKGRDGRGHGRGRGESGGGCRPRSLDLLRPTLSPRYPAWRFGARSRNEAALPS